MNQEQLAELLAEALWQQSTLRHGLFTPPEFIKICKETIEAKLAELGVFEQP